MNTEQAMSEPLATYPRIVLRAQRAGTFWARHPWVLDRSIESAPPEVQSGDVVDLVSSSGRFVARGIYNADSRIRVRLYSWNPAEQLSDAFFLERLRSAIALRRDLGMMDSADASRLVFSEADSLSGLIVDRYADHLVVQLTAQSVERRLPLYMSWLASELSPSSISLRIDDKVRTAEGLSTAEQVAVGVAPPAPVVIEQQGVRYLVDLGTGQKTGFYLDQRDNRRVASQFASGRQVLDVCCYSGGFSLTIAALGEPASVIGVDSSKSAIAAAQQNAALNGSERVSFEVADCFRFLEDCVQRGRRFGLVVLDPPRFVGSRRSLDSGMRAYHRLNRLAVECVEPEGFLVTCSCSGLVNRQDFWRVLGGVSQKTGREIQLLQQRGASADHPVSISCPETDYLKCFVCRVR